MNPTTRLSALNFSGLLHQQRRLDEDRDDVDVDTVVRYICPTCEEEHEWKDDAVECCREVRAAAPSGTQCPVCASEYVSHRDAADCCLWRDLDAATRWRIADQVHAGDGGVTWAEALLPFAGAPA